jgi:hypothetical protein
MLHRTSLKVSERRLLAHLQSHHGHVMPGHAYTAICKGLEGVEGVRPVLGMQFCARSYVCARLVPHCPCRMFTEQSQTVSQRVVGP